MLTPTFIDRMCCPACPEQPLVSEIRLEKDGLIVDAELACAHCNESFAIRDGIPDMVNQSLMSNEEWILWQQHLEGFQARRDERIKTPGAVINQFDKSLSMQEDFATFTGIEGGAILDVGCGPGKFRHRLEGRLEGRLQNRSADGAIDYVGLDPIPLPECQEFSYLRGLAERIPLRANSMDHVTTLGALDHFKDRDAFFREIVRVLKPGGSFHLLQSVHEVRGPWSLLKWLAHEAKDALEDRTTKSEHAEAPKHMKEYSRAELRALLSGHFRIEREELYSPSLLNPFRLFVTMTPL